MMQEPSPQAVRAATRRDKFLGHSFVSCRGAAEIAADVGIDALDVDWWRKQCDTGLKHLSTGRNRYIDLNVVMDVLEQTVRTAIVTPEERVEMVSRISRRAVLHAQRKRCRSVA